MTLREKVAALEADVESLTLERNMLRAQLCVKDHPIRGLIRAWLAGRRSGSPRQFTDEHQVYNISLGVAAYHFRVLAQQRVIRRVRERAVRGATEHFYRLMVT